MHYRSFSDTTLHVSEIGLGCAFAVRFLSAKQ